MNNLLVLIGERLRNLRKEKDWSQEELADRADVHFTYIGKIERSELNPTLESVDKITRALGITLEDFFRYIQPSETGSDSQPLTQIINHLQNRSSDDQKKALYLLEFILHWKDE